MACQATFFKHTVKLLVFSSCSWSLASKAFPANDDHISVPSKVTKDCVILLHGLARTSTSMASMGRALREQGFSVVNQAYPSRSAPIEELSSLAIGQALMRCGQRETVHFVTHSMGGILLRQYLRSEVIENLGRVVMLGPPNQGSALADMYSSIPLIGCISGPALQQLSSDVKEGLVGQMGPVNFELGVIAGDASVNPILSYMVPGKDDGKVSGNSTKIGGMKQHITIGTSHPFMMRNKKVIQMTIRFLKQGSFTESRAPV